MCGWNNNSVAWKIGNGSRAKSGTGPTHDHTFKNESGSFLYLDSQAVNASQTQILQSPFVQWKDSCLSFWYHMRGSGIRNLSIYIEKNSTTGPSSTITKSSNRTILWSQEGELDDKWYAVEITIQTEEAFRVLLEGTTIGKTGNIAVDDIKLSKYSCKADDYYMHIDASLGNKNSNAILRHAGLYRSGPACLTFWYHMYGKDMGKLILYTSRNDERITTVWCKSGDQGNNWNFAAVDVEVCPDVSVEFEAIRGNGGQNLQTR
ncbi:hypothetical protein CHS0354_006681 [Potamilus streckersoni]|uniref:MAM domain-containing protein n=1 Tax=Potamilus streckersoni TaxID=2493646 RepID=A0AAE0SYY8_9BIVA|nr:hypothetical protein CHS0354_006681 [Potamilus streckersoni]